MVAGTGYRQEIKGRTGNKGLGFYVFFYYVKSI